MISEEWSGLFCSEQIDKIENYGKAIEDTDHMWECHHRAEILPCGVYSRDDLKKHGLYWNRPANELIYLRHDVHRIIHAKNRKSSTTKKIANSTRKRMAGKKLSDIHKKKLSESHIGHRQSVEAIEKQISSRKEYYKNNDKKGSKPVVMKTTDGVLTLRFSSSRRAVEWLREHGYPKASKGNITACACGLLNRCYKATWRYDI